jgi:hypothetical protein
LETDLKSKVEIAYRLTQNFRMLAMIQSALHKI